MDFPVLDTSKKYRAIKSSAQGMIYIQNGAVFEESGKYIGPALEWGPDLFKDKDGNVLDPFQVLTEHAQSNYVKPIDPSKVERPEPKEESIDDVFEAKPTDQPKKRGWGKKIKDGIGHGSGSV